MPDIQTLTFEVQRLQTAADWWANLALWLTAITAVIAAGYFVASRLALNRGSQARTAQATLASVKEQQFIRDLKEKDRQIATANEKASDANERARTLEVIAERLKKQNLELEQRLAHRRISPGQHDKFVAALRPYAGSIVALTKLGDLEAGTFADDILSVLADAGWRVNLTTIGIMGPPRYGLECLINDQSQAGKSLITVMRELPTASIESSPHLPMIANIIVGLRPPP